MRQRLACRATPWPRSPKMSCSRAAVDPAVGGARAAPDRRPHGPAGQRGRRLRHGCHFVPPTPRRCRSPAWCWWARSTVTFARPSTCTGHWRWACRVRTEGYPHHGGSEPRRPRFRRQCGSGRSDHCAAPGGRGHPAGGHHRRRRGGSGLQHQRGHRGRSPGQALLGAEKLIFLTDIEGLRVVPATRRPWCMRPASRWSTTSCGAGVYRGGMMPKVERAPGPYGVAWPESTSSMVACPTPSCSLLHRLGRERRRRPRRPRPPARPRLQPPPRLPPPIAAPDAHLRRAAGHVRAGSGTKLLRRRRHRVPLLHHGPGRGVPGSCPRGPRHRRALSAMSPTCTATSWVPRWP